VREAAGRNRATVRSLSRALAQARPATDVAARTLAELRRRLPLAAQRALQARVQALARHQGALALLDVQNVLERGFAIVRDARGAPVTDCATLAPGAALEARFASGGALLRVERARPHDG